MQRTAVLRNAAIVALAACLIALIGVISFGNRPTLSGGNVAAATPTANGDTPRSVSIAGNGEVKLKPDIAYVTFGVETNNPSLATAQSDNTKAMNAVIDRLKGLGIAEKDMQTVGYHINPQYDRDRQVGYIVSNGVRATIRDLNALGSTIDAAVTAGANRVNGVTFDVANREDAVRSARAAAVADARDKADQYAKLTNVTLGGPLQIVEDIVGSPVPIPQAAPAAAAPNTPILTGESTIHITVRITYELR